METDDKKLEKVKQDILNSGIPSEIEISSILQKDGWIVINHYPYFDENEKKVRSGGIISLKISPKDRIFIILIIECKKSKDQVWTFHTQKRSDVWAGVATFMAQINRLQNIGNLESEASHLTDPNVRVGTTHYIPFKKKNDEFFEALGQVLSASNSSMRMSKGMTNKLNIMLRVYPVIVFDGDIYEFFLEAGKMEVRPIEYLQFITGGMTETRLRLIDIVKKDFFPAYLTLIDNEIEKAKT